MRELNSHVGHFMVAVGAIIELAGTDKILVTKRDETDHLSGEWELMYGRIDQFEELEQGLKREVKEETGLTDIKIKKLLSVWHIHRGQEKRADNEVYGLTFICQTATTAIHLSKEHSTYRWLTPTEALTLIKTPGIRRDVQLYLRQSQNLKVHLSNINNQITTY